MAIEFNPSVAKTTADVYSLKAVRLTGNEGEKLSYAAADGRAFDLTLSRTNDVNFAVYSRQDGAGKVDGGIDAGKAAEGGTNGLGSDPMLLRAIKQYRDLIISQLLGNFGETGTAGLSTVTDAPQGADFIASLQISQELTISMDTVDTDFWSVENTAQRLVDFAKSLYAGGDKQEHLQKMMDGLDQGFAAANEAFGGALPDISQKTVDLAKQMLSGWASEGQVTAA